MVDTLDDMMGVQDDMVGVQDDMVDALDAPKEFEETSHIGSLWEPM